MKLNLALTVFFTFIEFCFAVDPEVKEFSDGKNFYLFAIDYRKPLLSVAEFLNSVSSYNAPQQRPASHGSRNKLIHLR